ncbi:MAG: hypothetical protein GX417_06075 [Clostridiales bacterium]|nr:hypothetical protein [Clostridiales bacterium]
MKQQKSKKRLFTWVLEIFTIVVSVIVIISSFQPDGAFFKATICGQNLCLFIFSVWAWFFLVWIVQEVQLIAEIHFTRQNKIVIAIVLASVLAYYAYSLLTRQFIYYWDYALYYRTQLGLKYDFQHSGFLVSLVAVIKSIWYQDYSLFISIFLAAPFTFTPETANWFVATCAVAILPMLYWVVAIFIKLVEKMLQPGRREFFFIGGMVLAASFPVIHRALLYGQPDLFGLIFAFLIIALTMQHDFAKTERKRYLLIIVLTIMTCASRRWYMYWLVAYYACYGLAVTMRILRDKRWDNLKRMILFCLSAAASIAVVLFPMILKVLRTDYAKHYSYYNVGGFPVELTRQARYLGIGILLILLAGFLWAFFRKQTRGFSLLAVADGLFTILLFTRIQNMGIHHTLILVPAYLLLMLICLAGISRLEKKHVFQLSAAIVLGVSVSNAAVCGATSSANIPVWFSKVPLQLPRRNDLEQVKAVNNWLIENCTESEFAYMIPHGYPYNPDVFRSYNLPSWSIISRLPYGSAILGTHYFPSGLLLAKYVLTCEPFCNTSIAEKYNSAFLSEIPQKHFAEITQFDMGNGYTFFVYQRMQPTDREEILFYEDYFAQEDALFPEMFSGVLNEILSGID